MKRRRLKFVWGASQAIRGHWRLGLFGFYDRGAGHHEDGLAISVRGLLLWLGVALVGLYLAAATALFWFWEKNPYSLLTYQDALLRPIRRAEVRDLQGQAFIAQGTDALRAKRYSEAITLLRQGLLYHPGDLKARLTLAQFYVAVNQRSVALKTLQDGLTNDFPGRLYVQGVFEVAEQGEDYDLVVRQSERYLPQLQDNAAVADRRWLRTREFAALMAANRFTEALALAQAEEAGDTASEHRVLALLGLRRYDDTLAALKEWAARPGADQRAVLRLRARALREAKRFDEMDTALDALQALSPSDPRPRVFGIVQRAMGGRGPAAQAALDDFIFRFGGTTQNLQLAAEPLAEVGDLALVERVAAAAADRGYPAEPYQVLLVQTYVQHGDWAAARRTLTAMKPSMATGRGVALTQAWREWMRRLIDAGSAPGDTPGSALVEFLHNRPWPIKIYRKSIEALRQTDRLETTRDVIAQAAVTFPASVWLAAQRDEVAQALAAQAAAAAAASAAPVAQVSLPGEKLYFQRLDEALKAGRWADAENALRDARTAKLPPPWVQARDGDLRLAQMAIAQGRGEYADMIAAAKLALNGDQDRSLKVTEAARAVAAKGERETAATLAREVLRKSPDFPPAVRLLNELKPKPAPKK